MWNEERAARREAVDKSGQGDHAEQSVIDEDAPA
jgi:hypothetical protein